MAHLTKGFVVVLFAGTILLATTHPAQAAYYLYDWSSAQKVTDPVGDTKYAGRDIRAAYQAYDAGYLYFRIDLKKAPSGSFPPGYANTYGIYIDSRPGGAQNSNEDVPRTLSGIDFIVSSELEIERCNRLDWDPEFQVWKVDEFKDRDNLKFQATENGGKTLEWRVKDGTGLRHIGNSFTWWAATMRPGDSSTPKTYDLTNATITPIPGAAWLLGSGIVALVGLKRRKAKARNLLSCVI